MRYLVLVLLNLPIILLALVNIITQYKLKKASASRFRHQLILWGVLLVILVGSFPIYNLIVGNSLLDSGDLSAFDIVQTTAIVFLVYVANGHRNKLEQSERRTRELHEQLSIELSKNR